MWGGGFEVCWFVCLYFFLGRLGWLFGGLVFFLVCDGAGSSSEDGGGGDFGSRSDAQGWTRLLQCLLCGESANLGSSFHMALWSFCFSSALASATYVFWV